MFAKQLEVIKYCGLIGVILTFIVVFSLTS